MATDGKKKVPQEVNCATQWNPRVSPLLQVVSQFKGGQTIYSVVFAYFIIFLAVKCLLLLFTDEEKFTCVQFFSGQFNSIEYFIQLFIVHHLIMYTIVYPVVKNMRDKSFVLKLTAILTLVICKLAIYFIVYIKEDASATIRSACAFENTRIMMKCISFFYEGHLASQGSQKGAISRAKGPRGENDGDISLEKFTYFLFAPTLIYQKSYERTNKAINWRAFLTFSSEFVAIILIYAFWAKDLLKPALESHRQIIKEKPEEAFASYIKIFPYLVTNAILLIMAVGFGFLHSYLNAWAEILTFADRTFYKDWWVNSGPDETFRKWNRLVGSFLHRYFYSWMLSRGLNRKVSVATVFFISGLYHDYIIGIITCRWIPCFTLYLLVCAFVSFLSPRIRQIEYTTYMLTGSSIAFCLLGFMSMVLFH